MEITGKKRSYWGICLFCFSIIYIPGCMINFPDKIIDDAAGTDCFQPGTTEDSQSSPDWESIGDSDWGPCFIISQYVEASNKNQGIELYNCDSNTIDLADYSICIIKDDSIECGAVLDLTGTLMPQAVLTICNPGISSYYYDTDNCHYVSAGVTGFDGNDRLALMKGKTVIDALGTLDQPPTDYPWQNVDLHRKDISPFSGEGVFDLYKYYAVQRSGFFQYFGVPPFVR